MHPLTKACYQYPLPHKYHLTKGAISPLCHSPTDKELGPTSVAPMKIKIAGRHGHLQQPPQRHPYHHHRINQTSPSKHNPHEDVDPMASMVLPGLPPHNHHNHNPEKHQNSINLTMTTMVLSFKAYHPISPNEPRRNHLHCHPDIPNLQVVFHGRIALYPIPIVLTPHHVNNILIILLSVPILHRK